jgi:hypothetical protein
MDSHKETNKQRKQRKRRKGGIPWKSGTPIILSCTSLRGEATFKEEVSNVCVAAISAGSINCLL